MSSEDEEDICNITIVGGRYNGEKCSAKEGECEHSNSKAKRKRKQEDENEEDWNEDIIIDEEMCGEQTKSGRPCNNKKGSCRYHTTSAAPSRKSLPQKKKKNKVRGEVFPIIVDDLNSSQNIPVAMELKGTPHLREKMGENRQKQREVEEKETDRRRQNEPKKTTERASQDKESEKQRRQVNPEKDQRTQEQKKNDEVWDSFNVPQKIREETDFFLISSTFSTTLVSQSPGGSSRGKTLSKTSKSWRRRQLLPSPLPSIAGPSEDCSSLTFQPLSRVPKREPRQCLF